MDSFHVYLKKQLLQYVEEERKKGVSLEQIEKTLLDAGQHKNIIDEVFSELEKEEAGLGETKHKDPVENDLISQLKNAFSQFMAQASKKEVKNAKKDYKKTDTEELVEEVIEEAEVIEEKTMLEAFAFFIYLIGLALAILFTAGMTGSNIVNVAIGFSPAILNAFISLIGLKLADNVPIYVFIPVIITSVFYGIAKFSGLALFEGMEIEPLGIVNFIFAFAFNILMIYVRFVKPRSMKKVIRPKSEKIAEKKYYSTQSDSNTEIPKEILELKKEFKLR